VERLLELFNQFSLLVKDAFNDDPRFLTARDKAYKQVINDTQVFRLELPSKQVTSNPMHNYKQDLSYNSTPPQNIVEKWQ
jgi:hypothetical protein